MERKRLLPLIFFLLWLPLLPLMATTWTPSTVISPSVSGQPANNPQISAFANGTAVAVWQRVVSGVSVIESTTYNGSTWGPVSTISGPDAEVPQVSASANGTAVAVWRRNNGTTFVIESATFNGSTWGPVTTISPSIPTQPADDPQVSTFPNGNAVAVWQRFGGLITIIESATFNGSTWGPVTTISPPFMAGENTFTPQVSTFASGKAVAVWARIDSAASAQVIDSATFNGSTWGFVSIISPAVAGEDAFIPQVSASASGSAVAVWERDNGTVQVIESATFNGSTWGPSTEISPSITGQTAELPQVSTFDNGTAVAVWRRNNGTVEVIESATFNGSTWGPVSTISPSIMGQPATLPQVSTFANGTAVAVWQRLISGVFVIESATYNGSTWGPVSTISPPSTAGDAFIPQVSTSANGTAVAVWVHNTSATQVIEAAIGFADSSSRGACHRCRRCSGRFR